MQGSLFDFDETSTAVQSEAGAISDEVEVEAVAEASNDYESRYIAAVEHMNQGLDDACAVPALGQLLALSCELLAQKPLMQYSFSAFMELWAAESGYGTEEQEPPALAYEPVVRVAYDVLLEGGLILAPQS